MKAIACLVTMIAATIAVAGTPLGYSHPKGMPAVVKMYEAGGIIQSGHVVRLKNATTVEKCRDTSITKDGVLGVSVGPDASSLQHVAVQTEGTVDCTTQLAHGKIYVADGAGWVQTWEQYHAPGGETRRLFVVGVGTQAGNLFLAPYDTNKILNVGT